LPIIAPDLWDECGQNHDLNEVFPEMMFLPISATLLLACGLLLMRRLRSGMATRTEKTTAESRNRLSVIIPARNEAHNLPHLLESLAAQSLQPHEVIVVDDGSTDDTAEVSRRLGARVMISKPLPEEWRGKTWACHQGAETASGSVLCFVDADARFDEPDGLRNLLEKWQGGAYSVCPWHAVERPWEHLSLFFNLNMVLGTVPDGLFGQLLLIDRESYQKSGGHEKVRDKVLENFRFAGHCREAGVTVRSSAGRGIISFRMYPGGMRDMIEGWTKGFASGAGQTSGKVLGTIIGWFTGLMLTSICLLVNGFAWPWVALYLMATLQVGIFARRVGDFRWWLAPLFPLALVFFFWLFARSARRSGKPVTWKGREIHAD
jgi:4,4'-diaponeurosporenoate glycosyltransferase